MSSSMFQKKIISSSKPAPSTSVAGTGTQSPSAQTESSTIVADVVTGSHVLKIKGYSIIKERIGTGKYIKSEPFAVGGYRWYLRYYPNGCSSTKADWVAIYLFSVDGGEEKVRYKISLLDHAGEPVPACSTGNCVTCSVDPDGGFSLVRKKYLEESAYLRDGCFSVRCDLSIYRIRTEPPAAPSSVAVSTSDLHRHLGHLLSSEVGSDVSFEVDGEWFNAHRCILAARSSVFMAELLGTVKKENMNSSIRIYNVEAKVFETMLRFIYTDSLPEADLAAMAQNLLAVAARYKLERLRLICGDNLRSLIDARTVVTKLLLAEKHSCRDLKDACLDFLASPDNLKAVMGSDDFGLLIKSCPSILKELAAKSH